MAAVLNTTGNTDEAVYIPATAMGSQDRVASLINLQKVTIVAQLFHRSDKTAQELKDSREQLVRIGHRIGRSQQKIVKISKEQLANRHLEEEARKKLLEIQEAEREALKEVKRCEVAREELSAQEVQLSEKLEADQKREAGAQDHTKCLESHLKRSATRNYDFTNRYTRPFMISMLEQRAKQDAEFAGSWSILKKSELECQEHHVRAVAKEICQILMEDDNDQPKETQEQRGLSDTDRSVDVEDQARQLVTNFQLATRSVDKSVQHFEHFQISTRQW